MKWIVLIAIAAALANTPHATRTRPLSPREVYDAGKSDLLKLPITVAGLLMDELPGSEVTVRHNCLTFQDADADPEPMQFGLVRRDDIATDNSVQSTNIADARVEFYAEGALTDAQKRGWLAKVYEKLRPI